LRGSKGRRDVGIERVVAGIEVPAVVLGERAVDALLLVLPDERLRSVAFVCAMARSFVTIAPRTEVRAYFSTSGRSSGAIWCRSMSASMMSVSNLRVAAVGRARDWGIANSSGLRRWGAAPPGPVTAT
jgi:hypothetical protein